MTNYNHILNITKAILQFTAINNTYIYTNNYANQTIDQVCFSMYNMFNTTDIDPKYNSLINTLYTSINNTLNCSFYQIPHLHNVSISFNSTISDKLITRYLRGNNSYSTIETVSLLVFGIIISKIISVYMSPYINIKQKYV